MMKKDPMLMELSRSLRNVAREISNIAGYNEPQDAKLAAASAVFSLAIGQFIQKFQNPAPKSEIQVQAESLLKEVTGQDISLDPPRTQGYRKGNSLTYGQVKVLAKINGKVWCEYYDYEDRSPGSDTVGVWDVEQISNGVMLLQGVFGLELDFDDQPCDDSDVCDYENEYFRAVLFEAVPVKEK